MTAPAGLRQDSLGLTQSVVLGVAGTAPAFSMSATMVALIGAVGSLAPLSLVAAAVVMFGITFAYMHLNRVDPNAGAAYAWVSQAFNPSLGFLAGWALLVSSALFMVSATLPAASATLLLVRPDLAADRAAVALTAMAWLLVVTLVVARGIALTGRVQTLMTLAELAILALIVVLAALLPSPGGGGAPPASGALMHPESLAHGIVIGLFFFWGWDVALNVNEETRNAARTPGRGALLALFIVTAAFVSVALATGHWLTEAEVRSAGTNVLFALAGKLLPRPWSYAAVLALMLSTIGTLETSILQFSRTLFAQARDGALPRRLARVHSRWQTPLVSTFLIGGIGIVLLAGVLFYPSVDAAMMSSIDAISIQAAFYYGLAALAWVRLSRGIPGGTTTGVLLRRAWPAASAVILWVSAGRTLLGFDLPTAGFAIGGIAIGLVPLALWRRTRQGPQRPA